MPFNEYEDDAVRISVAANSFPDRFEIVPDLKRESVAVRRVDEERGWGQNLHLVLLDKLNGSRRTIRVGPSPNNTATASTKVEPYHTISARIHVDQVERMFPKRRKICFALATIPSRIKRQVFFDQIEGLIKNQSMPADKVFVTVSERYKRLGNSTVDRESLDRLKGYEKVDVIVSEDFGPASKYLGPLIHRKEEMDGGLLVVVDDDRFYNRNLIKHFSIGFDLYPECRFATGDGSLYFRSDYDSMSEDYVSFRTVKDRGLLEGFYGFCIKAEGLEEFVEYQKRVLDMVPESFFHDEGISKTYLNRKKENLMVLDHIGCYKIKEEPPDALCKTTPLGRPQIESKILSVTVDKNLLE